MTREEANDISVRAGPKIIDVLVALGVLELDKHVLPAGVWGFNSVAIAVGAQCQTYELKCWIKTHDLEDTLASHGYKVVKL